MQLFCAKCGTVIPADNINIGTGLAKCSNCNELFNFLERLPNTTQRVTAPQSAFAQPPNMTVDDWKGVMRIRWRWFNWTYVPLLGFCIFWDGFLVFWYTLAFTQHGQLIMKLFPVMHVAVGVSLTYKVLTGFFNSTLVEVGDAELSVHHGPFPWWGNRRIPSATINQVFCQRNWTNFRHSNETGPTYSLSATFGGGKQVRLVGGLQNREEAKFLEQAIETKLKIFPGYVVGECNA